MWMDSHDHSDGGSFSSEGEMSYSRIISLINFKNIVHLFRFSWLVMLTHLWGVYSCWPYECLSFSYLHFTLFDYLQYLQ